MRLCSVAVAHPHAAQQQTAAWRAVPLGTPSPVLFLGAVKLVIPIAVSLSFLVVKLDSLSAAAPITMAFVGVFSDTFKTFVMFLSYPFSTVAMVKAAVTHPKKRV